MAFGLGLTSHPCQAQPAQAPRSGQPFPQKEACVGRGPSPCWAAHVALPSPATSWPCPRFSGTLLPWTCYAFGLRPH